MALSAAILLSKPSTKAWSDRATRPLDAEALRALALTYVSRYQTSSGKLSGYLRRKLHDRGWHGDDDPPVANIIAHCVELGYVDDRSFAVARASALARRGYGPRRIAAALHGAGVNPLPLDDTGIDQIDEARRIALIYAKRRRIGPYATGDLKPEQARKWIAAMINAGHSHAVAREIALMPREEN